jgi:hypothetical protein
MLIIGSPAHAISEDEFVAAEAQDLLINAARCPIPVYDDNNHNPVIRLQTISQVSIFGDNFEFRVESNNHEHAQDTNDTCEDRTLEIVRGKFSQLKSVAPSVTRFHESISLECIKPDCMVRIFEATRNTCVPLRMQRSDISTHTVAFCNGQAVEDAAIAIEELIAYHAPDDAPTLTSLSSEAPKVSEEGFIAGSFWSFNGSVMLLEIRGNQRRFSYHQPRDALKSLGIVQGMILFDGQRRGKTFVGSMFTFAKCGRFETQVVGDIGEGDKSISFTEDSPVIDSSCRRTGSIRKVLDFTFIEMVKR